jgi:3,4-dihydroxy 2-butanone 4-phosphate synthase/GTP cyclohydrolase II
MEIASRHNLKIVTIKDLIAYRIENESLIEPVMDCPMPTRYGNFQLHAFRQLTDGSEHLALVKGSWEPDEPILVRVHSSSMIGDVFGSERFGRGHQLHRAMEMIEAEGKGVIVYIHKDLGDGLVSRMEQFAKAEENPSADAPARMDVKDYGIGAQILRSLGVRKIRRMSNHPKPRKGLIAYGLEIVEDVTIAE